MSGNAQKTPLGYSLNEFSRSRSADAAHITGKRLPCHVVKVSGAIVTVAFDVNSAPFTLPQVEVPIANSIYAREPTQVGDKGYVQAADARLGGASGLGAANPDLSLPSNLGALVFVPIGNANWPAAPDPNKYLLQGPKGFYLRDLPAGSDPETFSIVGDKDAKTLTLKVGTGVSIVVDQNNVTVTGSTKIELIVGNTTLTVDSTGVTVRGTTVFVNDVTIDGNLHVESNLTVDGNTSLGGGAQAIKLADGSNSTTVTAT